jgi:hypothetical protein
MHTIIKALKMGTIYDKLIDVEYVWRLMRERHDDIICPDKQVNNEDRRVDWLTYANVMVWNKRAIA